MATARDSLRSKVDRLSEEEAQEILSLIAAKRPDPAAAPAAQLTWEVVRGRLAGKAAFRVPPANAAPFRKHKRIECHGIPASETLIADRR